jgi:hypothetical protein
MKFLTAITLRSSAIEATMFATLRLTFPARTARGKTSTTRSGATRFLKRASVTGRRPMPTSVIAASGAIEIAFTASGGGHGLNFRPLGAEAERLQLT